MRRNPVPPHRTLHPPRRADSQRHSPLLLTIDRPPTLVLSSPTPIHASCRFIRCPQVHDMTPLKPQAAYDDFARLDIRIGKVVDVQPFPRARKPSYKVGVDVGADRIMC